MAKATEAQAKAFYVSLYAKLIVLQAPTLAWILYFVSLKFVAGVGPGGNRRLRDACSLGAA